MIGVWTGCGFFTVPVITPPPDLLGYDGCVPMVIHNPLQPSNFQSASQVGSVVEDEIPTVII